MLKGELQTSLSAIVTQAPAITRASFDNNLAVIYLREFLCNKLFNKIQLLSCGSAAALSTRNIGHRKHQFDFLYRVTIEVVDQLADLTVRTSICTGPWSQLQCSQASDGTGGQ